MSKCIDVEFFNGLVDDPSVKKWFADGLQKSTRAGNGDTGRITN